MTLIERLLAHTDVTEHGLIWTGSINARTGYGQIRAKRPDGTWTVALVHRVWYAENNGVIPTGYDVDHTCRVRDCLTHLRAIPKADNRSNGRWRAHRLRIASDLRYYAGRVAS